MKKLILTLGMAFMACCVNAQVGAKPDTVKGFINPEDFRTDSVKRGNEVYHNKSGKPDTLSAKPTKKQPAGKSKQKEVPNQATKKE